MMNRSEFLNQLADMLAGRLTDLAARERAFHELQALSELRRESGFELAVASEEFLERFSAPVRAVLFALANAGLTHELPEFLALLEAAAESKGICRSVRIESAVPLNKKEQQDIVQALTKRFSMPAVCLFQTNPGLIGGLRAEAAGWVFDGSVRGRLDRLMVVLQK